MDFFKARLIVTVLAGGLVTGGALGIILYYIFPSYFPEWFGGTLLFFLVIESLTMLYIDNVSKRATPRQLTNAYLLTKVVKMLLSIVYVAIYWGVVKEGIKSFVLTFIIFYLIFLFIETFLFMKIEKRLKQKKQQE